MTRFRVALLAAVTAAVVAFSAAATDVVAPLERDAVDVRFALRADERPKELVVVAIDDVTFDETGRQWPFNRKLFAGVTRRIDKAGAREIVFDVQFTEETTIAQDWALYSAIDRAGGAVLATSETDGKGGHKILGGPKNLKRIDAVGAAANLPGQDSGVIRRFDREVDGLPTIAAEVARRQGRPVPPTAFGDDGAWIDFRGKPGTIRTVSFVDVEKGRVPPSVFADKIVVIGASAPTLQDVHPTSASRAELMAGPEIQANAIWTALHGNPLRDAPAWAALLAIALLSLLVPFAGLRLGPVQAIGAAAAIGAAYVLVVWAAFTQDVMLPVVAPLVAVLVGTVTSAIGGQLLELRERMRVSAVNERLEAAVRERTADLDALQREIIERLGQAVDSRDEETGDHIHRIGEMSHRIAMALGWDVDRAEMLRRASAMHDVGKIAIPDAILQHPGPLTPKQWEIMRTHTTEGARILAGSRSPLVQMAEVIALTHHEKWDGSGYPAGTAGDDIPVEGRIVALCDVYDALTSRRPYKEPWSHEDAVAEIRRSSGTHFDPDLAEVFLLVVGEPAGRPELAGV